ncbi:hypothetical protein HK098_007544 [Nowakowskiella sp. JEL0407]|nr:hypothetical protein HK098_007544 [Nowakowskiella sp. JEL0407]
MVARVTRTVVELSSEEYFSGISPLSHKISTYRPKIVVFDGDFRLLYEDIEQVLLKEEANAVKVEVTGNTQGMDVLDSEKMDDSEEKKLVKDEIETEKSEPKGDSKGDTRKSALIFVLPNTSGRVVQFQRDDKEKLFRELKALRDNIATMTL